MNAHASTSKEAAHYHGEMGEQEVWVLIPILPTRAGLLAFSGPLYLPP